MPERWCRAWPCCGWRCACCGASGAPGNWRCCWCRSPWPWRRSPEWAFSSIASGAQCRRRPARSSRPTRALRAPPPSPQLETEAQSLGLQSARLTTLISVVFRGDASQLANVRAVSAGYPLRGSLKTAAQAFAAGDVTHEIPAAGSCWPDSRLAASLGAHPGDTLMVGARALRVERILIARPDQGSSFVEFAPSLLFNEDDLAATQLVQPASRMQYALLLAGSASALGRYDEWFTAHARPPERLARVADASPQIGDPAPRASRLPS